jgi:uncharacterized heparinase superfamily protein
MLDLLPLGQVFAARNVPPPPALLHAVDRVMPMLRFFRHGDGRFALFNGMGPTQPDLLATILAYDDNYGAPPSNAPHSGYQRLEARDTILIMDTGRPPPFELSADANAGCLSFELSTKQRIVVNCGMPEVGKANWRDFARSSAAHSTIVLNDVSSCRFLERPSLRRLFGNPIIDGPRHVSVEREETDDAISLRASHDGYFRRFSLIHRRNLTLAADGKSLEGEDLFSRQEGEPLPRKFRDTFAVRFHLHPEIRASKLPDALSVALLLPNKDVWTFSADADEVVLEDSVFLAGQDGPRRTQQIVITGVTGKAPRVAWRFCCGVKPKAATAKAAKREKESKPSAV